MKKKKTLRRTKVTPVRKSKSVKDYLLVIKSWMFVVAFALMLGIGAIVGSFVNSQLEQSSPAVAGVQTEAQ